MLGACNFPKENAQRATWTLGKTLHRFVPNVKFSRLQRSQRKFTVRNWTLREPHITLVGACNFLKENAQRATWTLGTTLHRFVPNVKFSRLQRSLKKIHSEEPYSGIFGLVVLSKINFHNK